jgi:hypothetical protein
MNVLISMVKLLASAALAAVAMGLLGLLIASIAAPIIIPGNNPHTDLLGRLGITMAGTLGGAALGVIGVLSRAAYQSLNNRRFSSESIQQ